LQLRMSCSTVCLGCAKLLGAQLHARRLRTGLTAPRRGVIRGLGKPPLFVCGRIALCEMFACIVARTAFLPDIVMAGSRAALVSRTKWLSRASKHVFRSHLWSFLTATSFSTRDAAWRRR